MSCGELFLKSASTTFTGYFLIVGISFILYGLSSTYYLLKTNTVATLEDDYISLSSACLILFGASILLGIILGCCGVCREIPSCLETYAIFMTLLATAQFSVGIFCLMQFHDNNTELAERIHDDVNKMYLYYGEQPQQLDDTQTWLECCGISGPENWTNDNRTFPASCCSDTDQICTFFSPNRYNHGCSFLAFEYIVATNYIIGWSLIIVGITELIAAMMGISLSCAYWRNSRIMWI